MAAPCNGSPRKAHYATVEGDEAMRFAIGLAVLDHSRYASA